MFTHELYLNLTNEGIKMNEKDALKIVNQLIVDKYGSIQNAAVRLGVTTTGLKNALDGKQHKIPPYLLKLVNMKMVVTYEE